MLRDRLRPSRTKAVNAFLALALAVVVVMTLRVVTSGDEETDSSEQTATVETGVVTATVSASGNVESARTVNANFSGAGGTVAKIYVKEGQKVHRGDPVAQVDQDTARQELETARASLRSAQAAYETTTQGQTSSERALDQQSIVVAQESVDSARVALSSARETQALDRRQHNAAVESAQGDLDAAESARDQAEQDYAANASAEHQAALQQARADVQTAQQALVSARTTRASVLLADHQQVESQAAGLRSAEAQLSSTRASVAVNQQGARSGSVASAQAQIDSAEVQVDAARTSLSETVLRAPANGTVTAINGSVGGSSSSTGSTDTSSESTSTTSTTSTSGFVTMTALGVLEVTADVAEADIGDVEVGQAASITLSANDAVYDGQVTGVDTVETITNNVVEYGVTVQLQEAKGVKLGQTSQIEITTGSEEGVLRVSSSALTTIGNQTTATVRHDDGTTDTVMVTTGLEGDSFTEILDGLSEGDVVVLPEQDTGSGGGFTFPGGGIGGGGLGGPP